MDERQQRGLVIAATARIVRKGDAWVVPSQSLNGKYTVRLDTEGGHCTCPDFELRQTKCKHQWAVEMVVRRETTPDGTVVEMRAMRVTYSQDWTAYNAAQTSAKEHFCRLLRDLTANIPTPPQSNGRPRLPLSDMLFAAAFKVYSGFSSRRFSTELRDARGKGFIAKAPHFNSVLGTIESEEITPILHDLITASSLPLRELEQDFAVDSTGFGTCRYYRYFSEKYGHEQLGRVWIKTHAMVGVKTNVVTALKIGGMNDHDSPQFPELVESTAQNFTVREVYADKAYSSRANLELVEHIGGAPYIPFKSNAKPVATWGRKSETWTRLYHFFALNREDFCAHYHKRSNVEATFSMIKRVFGDSVRAKTPTAQKNEVLLKVLCHNIRVLIHEMCELGIEPMFGQTRAM